MAELRDQSNILELSVVRHGSKWWVGWPYSPVPRDERRNPNELYRLPDDPRWAQLRQWWHRFIWKHQTSTRAALLEEIDRAVRYRPPPVPFRLVRLQDRVREYEGRAQ